MPKSDDKIQEVKLSEMVGRGPGREFILTDGDTYTFYAFTFEECERFCKSMGKIFPTDALWANFFEPEKTEALYEVLRICFEPFYPDITVDQIKKLVTLHTAKKIIQACIDLTELEPKN